MKILKFTFIFLLLVVVIGAIYLASLDESYDVKRSKVIHAKPEVVFNDLNDYKNWKDWGPWYEEDSTIVTTYSDNTIGEGGTYSWTSKDGEGLMKTLKVVYPKSLDQEIIFKTPFGDMKSDVYWILERAKDGTNLTWGMKGQMGFLLRWMASGMEDQIGPMEERGLELFDENIQKKTKIYSINTNGVVDYSGGFYLYTTTSCRIDEIDTKFPEMLMNVSAYIKSHNIRTNGSPFSIYHKFDQENGTTMFSVCYPIAEKIITESGTNVVSGYLNRGKYFKTTLKGSYDNSKEAWEKAIKEAGNLEEYKILEDGEPFEVYVNSPLKTFNPADLITEIYIPVERVVVANPVD